MRIIAIKSNRELDFDLVTRIKGIVTVRIKNYEKKVDEGLWRVTLEDTCVEEIVTGQDEEGNDIIETKTQSNIRFSEYDDATMNQLSLAIQLPAPDPSELAEYVENVFRQGLLLKTQMECADGKGIYLSEAQDWEIFYNEGEARPAVGL